MGKSSGAPSGDDLSYIQPPRGNCHALNDAAFHPDHIPGEPDVSRVYFPKVAVCIGVPLFHHTDGRRLLREKERVRLGAKGYGGATSARLGLAEP